MLGMKIGLNGMIITICGILCLTGFAMENIISMSVVNIFGITGICLFGAIFIISLIAEQ